MIKYLYSLMMVFLTMQCDEDALPKLEPQQEKFGKAFLLEKESEVMISGEGAEALTLQLYRLADSRCPEDVVCVWMGNATAALKASTADAKSAPLEFCIGNCRPDPVRSKHTLRAILGDQKYDITLLEVLPYPNTTNRETASQVKVLVEPVN